MALRVISTRALGLVSWHTKTCVEVGVRLQLSTHSSSPNCPFSRECTPQMGRPKSEVYQEVEYLRSLRFSWSKIANILGISRATLYRCFSQGMLIIYSAISDNDLDRLVLEIKVRQNPRSYVNGCT